MISIYFKIINILIYNCRGFANSYWILIVFILYHFIFVNFTFIFFRFLFLWTAFFYWIFKFRRRIIAKWWKFFFNIRFLSLFLEKWCFAFINLFNWGILGFTNFKYLILTFLYSSLLYEFIFLFYVFFIVNWKFCDWRL